MTSKHGMADIILILNYLSLEGDVGFMTGLNVFLHSFTRGKLKQVAAAAAAVPASNRSIAQPEQRGG